MAAGFKQATVAAASIPSTQSNFPAYVDLSRLGITTLAEAQSVRVYSDAAKTTELAREIVSATEMHVKVPSLTSTFTLYVDWDGISSDYATTATYGAEAVWSAYYAVYHMNGTEGTTAKKLDSTGNGNDLVENNSPVAIADHKGDTDGAYDHDGLAGQTGATTYDYLTVGGGSLMTQIGTSECTTSVWFKSDMNAATRTTSWVIMGEEQNSGSGRPQFWGFLGASSDVASFNFEPTISGGQGSGNTGTFTATDWNHYVFQRNAGGYPQATVNGTIDATGVTSDTASFVAGNNAFYIGRRYNSSYSTQQRYADGKFSEARIIMGATSTDWAETEYNNQSDEATFWGTWSDVSGEETYNALAFCSF